MEQQEEKKRKEHERRRQSKSTSSFPIDLTSEILLRLPAKSLERFRCVSKLWSSIITDPYFINLFETRSPRPSLLLCFRKDDNVLVYSIPQHKNSNKSYSSSQPTDRYHMKFPRHGCNSFTESVHGLICFLGFDETPIVWNPSKRQLLTLPKPSNKMKLRTCILGYDPIEGKHKLVCVPANRINCDVYQVLTLGSAQESWRMVKTNHKHRSYQFHTRGRCIKGVIYYYGAYIYKTDVLVIMSFDVRSEIFDMIQFPSDIDNDARMTTYKGKLACVTKKTIKGYPYETITLCILEDAEKHEWSSKDFLAPFYYYDQSLGTYFFIMAITPAGEIIYSSFSFSKSHYILFCDPVRNSYRRFEFTGIAEDVSLDLPWVLFFPNHIESQRSL